METNLNLGLLLTIYRPSRPDAEFGISVGTKGASDKCDQVIVVGTQTDDGPVEPLTEFEQADPVSDESPAMVLVSSRHPNLVPILVPLAYVDPETGRRKIPKGYFSLMPSGNYAGTDDSRWSRLGERVGCPLRLTLIPVYDTLVTLEEWLMLRDQMKALIEEGREKREKFKK